MAVNRLFSDKVWLVFKGLAMGAANKVPGVSGGIVAFVVGFYEEFIYSLQKINRKAVALLFNRGFKRFYQYINGTFLILLFLGMIISYFSVSKILDYFLVHYELYVWSTFFGMIIGSVYHMAKEFEGWNRKYLIFLLSGIIAGLSISFLEPATENDNLIFVFFCGIIGVSGMTLPGLSGSFILILLGNYVLLMVDAVNALFDTISDIIQWDFAFFDDPIRVGLLKVLIVFTLGSIAGLVTFSQFLGFLLREYKKTTYAILIGFMTGSLGVVWPWKREILEYDSKGREIIRYYERQFPTEISEELFIAVFFILIGILILLTLDWYQNKNKRMNG